MGENLQIEGRRSVRTPMQWTSGLNGGFSTADPEKLRRPVTDQPGYGPADVNVEDQRNDRNSLLNWFEHVIRQRRETPEIGWGDWQILETQAEGLVVLRYDWEGRTLVTLHNLSSAPAKAVLSLQDVEWSGVRDLLDGGISDASEDGRLVVELPAFGHRWLRLRTPDQRSGS